MNQITAIRPDVAARTRKIVRTFNLSERLFYATCKDPLIHFRSEDEPASDHPSNLGDPLRCLRREFPNIGDLVHGKGVLDYGCGDGYQSAALAKLGAQSVFGVDIDEPRIEFAKRHHQIPNVRYGTTISGKFDVAISQNSFEHFPRPAENLREISAALKPGGKLLLTFSPPWFAPYGSHFFYSYCPWVNILFSEKTIFKVRELYREDGVYHYQSVNKMTIARFERTIRDSGFKIAFVRYRAVKRLPLLTRIPLVRELLTNVVTCILEKP